MNLIKVFSVFIVIAISSTIITKAQISTDIKGFNKVEIYGNLNVRLEKSEKDSISIRSGNFDVSKVNFSVKDSLLTIKLLSKITSPINVNITVKFQHINALSAGGGANAYNRGVIESKAFELKAKSGCELDLLVNIDSAIVKVSKGAFVRLTGKNRYMYLKTTTGGDFRSVKMTNKKMVAVLNGGTVEILESEYLEVTARYGATLKYNTRPNTIKKKERLGGTVSQLEDF